MRNTSRLPNTSYVTLIVCNSVDTYSVLIDSVSHKLRSHLLCRRECINQMVYLLNLLTDQKSGSGSGSGIGLITNSRLNRSSMSFIALCIASTEDQ